MINNTDKQFLNKNVLILGNGISGKGAFNALIKKGANCVILDDKITNVIPSDKFDLIVISPSINLQHRIYDFAREHNIPLISEIELGYQLFSGQTIAVTGTNGKTTTTALIGEMLKKGNKKVSVCGNIGVSFAECAVNDGSEFAALEVSSFQLEGIKEFKPLIACITNISEDHLDRHKTMEEYIKAKLRIAENQSGTDFLILSQDDIPLYALKDFIPKSDVLYVSVRGKVRGAYMLKNKIYYLEEYICDRDMIRLEGNHNVSNALVAICVSKLLGVDNQAIKDALTGFNPASHRMSFVASVNGKNYYNDSKGTNIGATVKAIESMDSSTCLILGGSDKGYEFDVLFENLSENIKKIFVIGEVTEKIEAAAFRNKFYEIERKATLSDAVADAAKLNVENVLLSPATASFDMFKDYKDRGEQFEKLVFALKETQK